MNMDTSALRDISTKESYYALRDLSSVDIVTTQSKLFNDFSYLSGKPNNY